MRRFVVAVVTTALVVAAPVLAYHRKTPTLLQITPDGAGTIENARWAGFRYVVFDSDADLLANGSTGRQVFCFDLQERDRTGLLSVHQTTFGPGDAQHPSTGSRAKLIAYDAKPNGVGSRQIMVAPRLGGIPYAVTNGAADSINPVVDDGGRFVVFESQADLLGAGFGGSQIYLADLRIADPTCPYPCAATGNAGLRQITQKTGTSTHAVVSKGGRVVAFESDADLLSQGETETQIYRVDTSFGSTARVTKGPGASRHATLSKNGKTLAFESDANLLGAGSGGTQIFLFKKDATLQQVTNAQGALSTAPSLELTGRGILFRSTADLLHNNTTDPQVYEYDIASGAFRQVTDTSGTIRDPMYSAGVFTIFVANDDLLGNGSSGEQLYLVNLFALQNANVP